MPAKKQITKDMILNSALRLLKQGGIEYVNVKTLAKDLNCSTQPVYLSFSGMDELRRELIPLAVREFENIIKEGCSDNQVRLYSMEYINFAKNEKMLFSFLFMRPNAFNEMKAILSPVIEQSVEELMKDYHIGHDEADYLHDHLWMHAHGIASMVATDFCNWDLNKVERMLDECKAAFTDKYEV